jgi:hypothetical protein
VRSVIPLFGTVRSRFTDSPRYMPRQPDSRTTVRIVCIIAIRLSGCVWERKTRLIGGGLRTGVGKELFCEIDEIDGADDGVYGVTLSPSRPGA